MSYLEDYEKRILFSALAREKKVCKTIDRLEPPKGTSLVKIVESLERKFYYNRFEKEIRAKAIEDFTEALRLKCIEDTYNDVHLSQVFKIAEQMKGGAEWQI